MLPFDGSTTSLEDFRSIIFLGAIISHFLSSSTYFLASKIKSNLVFHLPREYRVNSLTNVIKIEASSARLVKRNNNFEIKTSPPDRSFGKSGIIYSIMQRATFISRHHSVSLAGPCCGLPRSGGNWTRGKWIRRLELNAFSQPADWSLHPTNLN